MVTSLSEITRRNRKECNMRTRRKMLETMDDDDGRLLLLISLEVRGFILSPVAFMISGGLVAQHCELHDLIVVVSILKKHRLDG